MTDNLRLHQLVPAQDSKEDSVNTQAGQLDAAMTAILELDIDSSNAGSVSQAQIERAFLVDVAADGGDPPSGDITITFEACVRGVFAVRNGTAESVTVEVASQSPDSPVIGPGEAALVLMEGVAVIELAAIALGGSSTPYDVGMFFPGSPTDAQTLLRYVAVRDLVMPTTGHQGAAGTAADAEADFVVKKNGASIGTFRFAAAGTVASLVSFSETSFAAGDVLEITGPSTADATAADISFTIRTARA